MISKTHSIRFAADLSEIMSLRAKALGYKDATAYIKGLVRYDALVQGPHSITLPISHSATADQDRVDAQLLDITRRGVGERGQLLAKLIVEIKEAGAEPSGAAIAKTIPAKNKSLASD